jgi:hypothetical protein
MMILLPFVFLSGFIYIVVIVGLAVLRFKKTAA